MASEEEARKRDEALEALKRDLEAARYAAQRAQKQYDRADPENRLVTDELERRWNLALQRVQELETRIDQHCERQKNMVTPRLEEFLEFASELQTVWESPSSDIRLKKRIVQTLIHGIVADVDATGGEVHLVIHGKGGAHTQLSLPRRHRGQHSCQTPREVVDAIRTLAHICTDDVIAGALNRNNLLTAHEIDGHENWSHHCEAHTKSLAIHRSMKNQVIG